ncbi:NAD(P)H-dependent oxidoreductase [Pedobacter sp. MC2016-14]|uniref:NAD(P)H-dependent oxidoreductase n=1 Tax=Pedobacter sp. MC2016-14 TaxID=2897327 RepID=UPI001E345A94|nr:NAD(P)H-dependent oxidoreductase [Pedobacter sp. MC2016-14]MCD0487812.1 NAD(P)H-dependent oxidoreductase [Pedobacter sp. MC2016-14]
MENQKNKPTSSGIKNPDVSRRAFVTKTFLAGAALTIAPLAFVHAGEPIANLKNQANNFVYNRNDETKTVLIINTHLTYPGWSEGKLNKSFVDLARKFFIEQGYKVIETKVEAGYDAAEEVEKHLQADLVILQTPVNWISTPWIYKKYVDEVFNSGLQSKKLLSGDGRVAGDPSKQYGTGGNMKGKKFMICATWNAAEKDFNDPSQYLYQGKGPADVFYNITTNYRFSGYEILEGYNCFDIFHNTQIKEDLEKYPAHLKKIIK